jgi:hypothetical protein
MDHLVRLETIVRRSFVRNEHVVSVFFYIKKAYNTTWKYEIMRNLFEIGPS